ncbi:hypothetical protein AGOR_G00195260 [Albula goreensis]|uniref:Uncharacterized protein n=1 Tax=Albula goreensis TaxID=1534307 RepID=A0A8T3CV41_9TELE|nr:hypothetical protein AGOR_G00195260 [Albula goreensis]
MSDAILTFQVQLSGVMETVLKSAMYEITRLVEDSFLEEVARSKQEVETLKQRLQWSESRRREREGGGRVRCADCGRAGVSSEETENTHSGTQPGADESRGLKQEKVLEGAWSSCPGETLNVGPPTTPQEPATPSPITAPDMSSQMPIDMEGGRNESLLKEEEEETEKESTEDDMQGAVELSALGEIVSGQQWSPDMSEDTAPPAGHILPEQLSARLSVGETGGLYMPESEHEHTARRVRLAGTPHSARLRSDLVLEHDVRKGIFQAGSDFTHENTDSEGLSAQPRMQPDSDCSSSLRALEPKPVTVYLDAVPIKQEVDSQADWDGDEEVYVPHRPLREVRGGRAPQPSAVTDHTSSRDLASCHGEFSEAECVTSQPRPQGRGSLVNHTQIRVTDSGAPAAHSTAASHKGVCSLNSKAFMASKSIQGHPRAFPGERRLHSPHFGKSVTQLINYAVVSREAHRAVEDSSLPR